MPVICPQVLALSFVSPLFLWAGLALAAAPIIIHLLNRRRFRVVSWAAMDFLLAALRKNRRRLRFEQWLLLAVRCLLLLLAGVALARPLACENRSVAALSGQRPALHVLILDNSYSMSYAAERNGAHTHLEAARNLARAYIDRLNAGSDAVVVFAAGAPASPVVARPSFDLPAVGSAIERIEQTHAATDLAGAMKLTEQVLREESRPADRYVVLFTDATRSAFASEAIAAEARELSASARLIHFNLGLPRQWNYVVADVAPTSPLVSSRLSNIFQSTLRGYGENGDVLVQWKLDGQNVPGGVSVRPDTQTPPLLQTHAALKSGGRHTLSVSLVGPSALPLDDTRHRVIEAATELKVLIVEGERGGGPLASSAAFLELALAPPRSPATLPGGGSLARSDSYVAPERISDLELSGKVLGEYRAVILCNVAQIQPAVAEQLRHFVQGGGTLLLFMGEAVSADAYNRTLLPLRLLPGPLGRRISAPEGRSFRFDFKPQGNVHSLLSVFRGEERSGLDTAQVFTYWRADITDPGVERVLNYIDGDPAITAHALGEGRVVFFSTSANADWTTLPAKPAYVTLVHELLAGSVRTTDAWMNLVAGGVLELPGELKLAGAPTLTDAAGQNMPLELAADAGGAQRWRSRPLMRCGLYTLSTGTAQYPVAVNPPAQEADVRTLEESALRRALGDVLVEFHGDTLPPPADQRSGGDFGWPLMFTVLLLAGVESIAAWRFGHYRRS